MLKTAPQGYVKDDPAIKFLRYKNFTIGKSLKDNELKNKQLKQTIIKHFQTLAPINDFLRKAGK